MMGRLRAVAANRRKAMRALYEQVPAIECKGLCADSCGPIEMSNIERATLRRIGVEITDRDAALKQLKQTGDFDCDALVEGRCSVYADRPMICRLWGVTEALRCPYGCAAERVLSDEEGMTLVAESLRVGGAYFAEPLATTEKMLDKFHSEEGQRVLGPYLKAMQPKDTRR